MQQKKCKKCKKGRAETSRTHDPTAREKTEQHWKTHVLTWQTTSLSQATNKDPNSFLKGSSLEIMHRTWIYELTSHAKNLTVALQMTT